MRLAPAARIGLALAGVLAGGEGLLFLTSRAAAPVTVDVGPNTGSYGSGFTPSEERLPTTLRWTRPEARLDLPLELEPGRGQIELRAGRMVDRPATIEVSVAGGPAASFTARPGGFKVRQLPFESPGGPLTVEIRSDDPELGVALDWLRIEGVRTRVPVSLWQVHLLPAGVFLLALLAGFGPVGAFLAGTAVAAAEAAWAGLDPFGLVHVAPRIALLVLLTGAVVALGFRRLPAGRWAALLFVASALLKGAALFHPSYFYPDVRQNHRWVRALASVEGPSLEARTRKAQVRVGVAYPRVVAGKKYAFPYSPVFYLPFTGIRDVEAIVDALKDVALVAAAAEVLVAFALASMLLGPRAGAIAALLATSTPLLMNRLLYAMWSTVAGHLLDVLAVLAAVFLLRRAGSWLRLALFAASLQLALLTYVSSLFNLTAFVICLALLERKQAGKLLLAWALATAVTLGWLYRGFLGIFFGTILPALLASGGGAAGGGAGHPGLGEALSRVVLFYGWGFPILGLFGLLGLRQRAEPVALRVFLAYGAAVGGLILLRGLSGGLFKDLKELEFAGPLFVVAAAAAIEQLSLRGRGGRLAAAFVAASLVAFGLAASWQSFTSHAALRALTDPPV